MLKENRRRKEDAFSVGISLLSCLLLAVIVMGANNVSKAQVLLDEEDTAAADPPLNEDFARQGQLSSRPSELMEGQEVIILPIRTDEAMYTGTLTHQSSKPVDVVVLNILDPGNNTAIPEEFGDLDNIIDLDGALVSISQVDSGTSGSVPFVGNAIGLVSDDEEPFLSTYSVNGMAKEGRIVNDITNILNSTSPTPADGEEGEEEEEEGEGEEENEGNDQEGN